MSGKQLCAAVLLLGALLAASAAAQDEKNELGLIFGRTYVSNQGIQGLTGIGSVISSGNAITIQGEYARRIFLRPVAAVSAEILFVYNPDQDLNAGNFPNAIVPDDYRQLFVTPAAHLSLFPETAVSPWVSFGGGFAHFSEGKNLLYGGANPGKNTSSGVLEFGGGLDVKLWRKMSLRGEVRDFWSGEPDFPLAPTGKTRQHNYVVGAGAVWRF